MRRLHNVLILEISLLAILTVQAACQVPAGAAPMNAPQASGMGRMAPDAVAIRAPRTLAPYFVPAVATPKAPDADGFLQRWLLLEPINKPNRSNNVFVSAYVRKTFNTEYFPNQFTVLPHNGDKVTVGDQELVWHALDSANFDVKLFRFAYGHMGPGHFGLLYLGDGVEKFSCHYEADLDRSGRSILDIRPLLWKDGWPVGGDNFQGGVYEIESERSGFGLQLAVDFVRMDNGRRGPPGGGPPAAGGAPRPAGAGGAPAAGTSAGGGFNRAPVGPVVPIPNQELSVVEPTWPTGTVGVDLSDYMVRPNQKWKITPVADVGGYPGSPYFRIQIAGTERTLAAAAEGEVVALPSFTGGPEQLWRVDQLTDGTYRIMPKSVPDSSEPMALTAIGASTPALVKFDPTSDKGRWDFKKP